MNASSPLGEARRERIVALARDLIRCKSLSGEERDIADVVARAMTALGYDEVKADAPGNVVGRLRPAAPSSEGALLFDSHMDTVAAAGDWTKDPFGGEVSDGRIWGRGASNMKGALAASPCSAAFARQDGRLRRDVLVCASVNIGYYRFCTNAARSAGMLGIPTLGFDPGLETDAHIADESLSLD